ncbi:hypothetical protein OSTOST_25123, partial [Ostertagia ostertagi]
FFVFLGKYLEIQFGVPQYRIQKYLAALGRALDLACGKKAATCAVCSLVAALLSFANGFVGCKSVIGQIGDQGVANNFSFPSCRKDCVCDGMPFYPVCNRKRRRRLLLALSSRLSFERSQFQYLHKDGERDATDLHGVRMFWNS